MTVYVTETLRLDVMWAGIALGVAAALEVPALLIVGRLSERFSHLSLIAVGCLAGIAYYLGLAFATGPVVLIGLQVLNACCFAGLPPVIGDSFFARWCGRLCGFGSVVALLAGYGEPANRHWRAPLTLT